jgi:hypothetical protein
MQHLALELRCDELHELQRVAGKREVVAYAEINARGREQVTRVDCAQAPITPAVVSEFRDDRDSSLSFT